MHSVNSKARKILDTLTKGLIEIGDNQKIDNSEGVFMAVHVECIGIVGDGRLYSVAHYFKQNGDMMRDPDVVFFQVDTFKEGYPEHSRDEFPVEYYPVSFEQSSMGLYQEAIVFCSDGIEGVRPKMQKSITSFCNDWMRNIKEQQGI